MQIELSGTLHEDGTDLRPHAERRFLFALSRFGERVRAVRVRVRDVNGPKGGLDKRCLVQVAGRGFPPLHLEVQDTRVESALDRAAALARRAVVKAIGLARPDVRRSPSHSGLRSYRG